MMQTISFSGVFQGRPISEKGAMPTMPVPWNNSGGEPEVWSWGNYMLVMQKDPIILSQRDGRVSKSKPSDGGIRHKFALSVFHRSTLNMKAIKKSMPEKIFTIEEAFYGDFAADFAKESGKPARTGADKGWGYPVACAFTSKQHLNYGSYEGKVTKDDVRKFFFKMVKSDYALSGEAVKIGTPSAIAGFIKKNPVTDSVILQDSKSVITPQATKTVVEGAGLGVLLLCVGAFSAQVARRFFKSR